MKPVRFLKPGRFGHPLRVTLFLDNSNAYTFAFGEYTIEVQKNSSCETAERLETLGDF